METFRTCSTPVPVMPAIWPAQSNSNRRKTNVQMPRKVQEPVPIGHYLEPLIGIAGRPDRAEVLRAFFASTEQ